MPSRSQPSRYQPLADYLAALPPATTRVTLTFLEIEAILGEPLPAGAGVVAWWSNSPAPGNRRVWRQAGWRAVQVRVRQTPPVVTFVRADSFPWLGARRRPPAPEAGRGRRRGDPPIVDG